MKEWSALKKLIYLHAAVLGGSGTEEKTVSSSTSPFSLVDAVAHAIISLTQTGKCDQASTPTPTSPVPIKCNNGTLGMVDKDLPSGYRRVLGYSCNNNAMWQITGFKLKGSDTVRISFSVTTACNVWGCYQGTEATDNFDLYVSTTSGSKYLRYGSGTYLSYWSPSDLGQRFDVVYTPTGTSGMPEDSTWTAKTFTSANDLLIGSTTTGGTSSKLKGNLYGNVIVENGGVERLHLIPCERVSDNVLGYFDTVGEAFYGPYSSFDGAVSLGYDGSHYELGAVGTPEVITVTHADSTTETASAENLYAVVDSADTQEIISGAVTRNVGYYVFKGTETMATSTAYGNCVLFNKSIHKWPCDRDCTPLCTHFQGAPRIASGTATENTCFFNAAGHFYFRTDDYETAAAFKEFLAAQYAAGTPVIVLFKLTTPTSESVASQPLSTEDGTNTITVTAEVSGISLTCVYKGTASS